MPNNIKELTPRMIYTKYHNKEIINIKFIRNNNEYNIELHIFNSGIINSALSINGEYCKPIGKYYDYETCFYDNFIRITFEHNYNFYQLILNKKSPDDIYTYEFISLLEKSLY